MKAYTQQEFNSLHVVNGVRQCLTGDYSAVQDFSGFCTFDENCVFINQYAFDEGCSFGLECSFDERFNKKTRLGNDCYIFGDAVCA
jgi:hypothetical protein